MGGGTAFVCFVICVSIVATICAQYHKPSGVPGAENTPRLEWDKHASCRGKRGDENKLFAIGSSWRRVLAWVCALFLQQGDLTKSVAGNAWLA